MADIDEDALSWKGDSDPSLVTGSPAKPPKAPKAASNSPRSVETDAAAPESTGKQTSSFLLVSYGILAGAYVVYTIGWILAIVNSTRVRSSSALTEIMASTSEYLAVASAALWFAGVFLLTRHSTPIIRLLWLLAGLLLLIPWPFVLVGIK